MMDLDDYQDLAQRTAHEGFDIDQRLLIACCGLAGEAGEVCDIIKKGVGHGHDIDPARVADELGDVLWYLAEIAAVLDVSLSSVATANIEKLRRRYPDGFSAERSRNRGDSDA